MWCDGSSIALGVVIEIAGTTVEDTDWLRKKDDFNHINVAELEAALKEINLAIKWGLKSIELVTASATAHRWIQLTLTEKQRVKTKGADEIMVKRRLGVLRSLVDVCGLNIAVTLVPRDAVWACWGGRLPPPRTGLPPPRIGLPHPPPPHTPDWVFSFEKLCVSAIQYTFYILKI